MAYESLIRDYLKEMQGVIARISVPDIEKVTGLLYDAWQRGSQVFICGNGGSAATATHFACDLNKAASVEGKVRFRACCLNDNMPLVSALTNDNGFDNLYLEQLLNFFRAGDVLVCVSVHGGAGRDKAQLWSQNLLKAMQYAQERGGHTVGLSGFDGGPMKELAEACIVVPVDSTPQVESLHLALVHLICSCLKRRIAED